MRKTRNCIAALCLLLALVCLAGCRKESSARLDTGKNIIIVYLPTDQAEIHENAEIRLTPKDKKKGEPIRLEYVAGEINGFMAELPKGDYYIEFSLEGWHAARSLIRIKNEPVTIVNLIPHPDQTEPDETGTSETGTRETGPDETVTTEVETKAPGETDTAGTDSD